jgi:hypothetical protein
MDVVGVQVANGYLVAIEGWVVLLWGEAGSKQSQIHVMSVLLRN